MELYCITIRNTEKKLNPNMEQFRPRWPKRTTMTTANKGEKSRHSIKGQLKLITRQMGGVLCRNSKNLLTILICQMLNIAWEKLAK